MKLDELLLEATFNLDEQVDYIWDKYFAEHSRNILSNSPLTSQTLRIVGFESLDLPPSKEINAANEINPVHIVIHNPSGNEYNPGNGEIGLSFSMNAYRFVYIHGSLDRAIEFLTAAFQPTQARNLKNEFTEARIKGSIYHELSHWLDDTLHNSHLKNMLGRARKVAEPEKRSSILNQNTPNVGLTTYEINAQIHNIKQLKRNHAAEWDKLTFNDMIALNPSLNTIHASVKNLNHDKQWKRAIFKRMHREGLLGKNMRP